MSLLDNQTRLSVGQYIPALSGGGGGGGGQNLSVSTINIQGSTDPLEITLPAQANDGFSVRQGGGTNALAILTIDTANAGQAEMGIRSLSTISGNPVPRGRLELQLVPNTDAASLSYGLDAAGSGNQSTIGSVLFLPNTAPQSGSVQLKSDNTNNQGTTLTVGNLDVVAAPSGSSLVTKKAAVLSGGNIYVPAAGTSQNIAQFSTIAGHRYELSIPNLRVQNEPAGVPTAGAWCQLTIPDAAPITYLDTFDMASVSTIANSLEKAPVYSFVASGTGHTLAANASLSGALSTAITIAPAQVYLRDMGIPAGMPVIG